MKHWRNVLISPKTTILETIKIIDDSSLQIAIVIDEDKKVLGTVTDGDIRRGILKNISLDSTVDKIMNRNPVLASIHDSLKKIEMIIKKGNYRHIPIVDERNCIVGLKTIKDILVQEKKENPVILMAGGLGTRLRPLTYSQPKPMLKVGNKPILETILEGFIDYNFYRFYIAVNYKSELIKEYFGDGSKWGVKIEYIHEEKRLGTAGALSLLKETPQLPMFVMNGDLLTKVNFEQMLEFHYEYNSEATMCVREYTQQISFGVVQTEGHRFLGIQEKPVQRYFVNAGIYILNPNVLELIPIDQYYDMPTLFEELVKQNFRTSVFPIREYWLDIGQMHDFEKANLEFAEVFE